jgi:hypothetical protein
MSDDAFALSEQSRNCTYAAWQSAAKSMQGVTLDSFIFLSAFGHGKCERSNWAVGWWGFLLAGFFSWC